MRPSVSSLWHETPSPAASPERWSGRFASAWLGRRQSCYSRSANTCAGTSTQTFEWTSPEFLADPYVHYKRLRETEPVHFNEARGGWVLTRYNDMFGVLHDDEHWSVAQRGPQQTGNDAARTMLSSDPPDHTRL